VQKDIWKDYYDIVILPKDPVRRHTIDLSRDLKRAGGVFSLGKRSYLPHLSIYHIPVRPALLAKFLEEVRSIASRSPGGALRLRSIDFPLLMTDKPVWLRRLHREMVNSTLPYFDWKYGVSKLWKVDRLPARFQPLARRYLDEFGSPMIDRVFRPHITLTTFDEKPAKKVRVDFKKLTFNVREIAVCELGPHHSCQRVVDVFPLARA
jgi:hypothetical protein